MDYRKILLSGMVFAASGVMAATPAYYMSFDQTVQADFGGTGSAATSTGDGSQDAVGMHGVLSKKSGKVTADKLLVPGLQGKAFASGKDAFGNIHSLFYKPVPAMRGNAGTVSFWLKPENWMGDDKNQHVFVTAANGSQRLLIYSYKINTALCNDNAQGGLFFLFAPESRCCQNSEIRSVVLIHELTVTGVPDMRAVVIYVMMQCVMQ